jgi:hypothetical protein
MDKKEKEVVLFASDTQESSSYLKRSVTKMRVISGAKPRKYDSRWDIVLAGAGDALVIDEVAEDIEFFLRDEIGPDTENPSVELIARRKEIGDLAYTTFKKYKGRCDEAPHFELLLGAADEFSAILHVTYEGKTQDLKRYGMIGMGRITGGELLMNEFFSLRDGAISQEEAANLAALIVTTVGHVDLSVGGAPDIKLCRNRTSWIYKEQPFNEILKTCELRWGVMKKVWWRMQESNSFERKLRSMLGRKQSRQT